MTWAAISEIGVHPADSTLPLLRDMLLVPLMPRADPAGEGLCG